MEIIAAMEKRSKQTAHLIVLALILLYTYAFSGCSQPSQEVQGGQHPYAVYDDIEVTVESVDRTSWYATVRRYRVRITVRSNEYDLTYTEEFHGSGICRPKQWDYGEGDIVTARLYSLVDAEGAVIERHISRID